MSFRKLAAGGKRDANEGMIVDALRGLGCKVYRLSGRGNPDLIVRSPMGRWTPLEVKGTKGTLTKAQADICWPVVRSVEDAIAEVWR